MKLQDLLLDEKASVKQAIEKLEKVRCKTVYVVKGRKLLASISDGDVRRFFRQPRRWFSGRFRIGRNGRTR